MFSTNGCGKLILTFFNKKGQTGISLAAMELCSGEAFIFVNKIGSLRSFFAWRY
jgi:hypothetical protein